MKPEVVQAIHTIRAFGKAVQTASFARTPACPPLFRFSDGLSQGWLTNEELHVHSCAYCQRIIATQWRLEPPSLEVVVAHLAGTLADCSAMELFLDENPLWKAILHCGTSRALASALLDKRLSPKRVNELIASVAVQLPLDLVAAVKRAADTTRFHCEWTSPDHKLRCFLTETEDGRLEIRINNPSSDYRDQKVYVEIIFGTSVPLTAMILLTDSAAEGVAGYKTVASVGDLAPRIVSGFGIVVDPIDRTLLNACKSDLCGLLQSSFNPAHVKWSPEETVHLERCNFCQSKLAERWSEKCPPKAFLYAYVSAPSEFPANAAIQTHLSVHNCSRCNQIVDHVNAAGLPLPTRVKQRWDRFKSTLGFTSAPNRSYAPSFGENAQFALTSQSQGSEVCVYGRIVEVCEGLVRIDLGRQNGLIANASLQVVSSWTAQDVGLLMIRELDQRSATGRLIGPHPPRIGDTVVYRDTQFRSARIF